jgi:hypothetical protein
MSVEPDHPSGSIPLWERACWRKRRISRVICRLSYRFREQARSHICFVETFE